MNIIINPARLNVAVNASGVSASTGNPIVKEFVDRPLYDGETTVTPTESQQTLQTDGCRLDKDVTINAIPSDYVGSEVTRRTSSDLTSEGATVTAPYGYYDGNATKSVQSATWHGATQLNRTPSISIDNNGLVTATIPTNSTNTTPIATDGYALANHLYPISATGSNTLQLSAEAGKTITPTEQAQTAVAAHKYTTGEIRVGAIPSDYVGSDVPKKSSSDLTANGATVAAPAGYYENDATNTIANASYSAISVSVTPDMSVDENGLVTASKSVSSSETPVSSAGYANTADTVQVNTSVSGAYQLPLKDSSDLIKTGATVNVPAGFYAENAGATISDAVAASASTVNSSPQLEIHNSTGVVTAQNNVTRTVNPIVTAGYATPSLSHSVNVTGSSILQLSVIGATTYTPTKGTAQTIPLGNFLTGDQTISAIPDSWYDMGGALSWFGAGAELVTTFTLADVKLSATDFNTWTPSTTAADILATRNAGTFTATDSPNWNYFIVWETKIPIVYASAGTNKAKPLFLASIIINALFRRPSTYDNIIASNYNNTVNATAYTGNFLRYYGTTTNTMTYTWNASYGLYGAATAATLSSASADSPTVTAKTPKISARCSTTYMSTGNAGYIDKDKTIISQKGYVYKAKRSTFLQGCYEREIALVNEVDK